MSVGRSSLGRLPDFIIIGAMKGGTTTAYWWLDAHPGTALPGEKEPDFFCRDDNFRQGLDWYATRFDAPPELVTGEASVKYTAPATAELSAVRIAEALPQVKLIAVLRDPVERLRSEYRFARQRGWEFADFGTALTVPDNPYVGKSMYYRCLAPYLDRFGDRLLVTRTEDLNETGSAWPAILEHLGLPLVPPPAERYNRTDDLPQMRPIAGLLDRPMSRKLISKLPASFRRMGRRAITDPDATAATRRRQESEAALPDGVVGALGADALALARSLGWAEVPWPSVRA